MAGDCDFMRKCICAPGVSTVQYFIFVGIRPEYYNSGYSVVKLLPDVHLMQSVTASFCYNFFH